MTPQKARFFWKVIQALKNMEDQALNTDGRKEQVMHPLSKCELKQASRTINICELTYLLSFSS